jgi:arginine decarboxylase
MNPSAGAPKQSLNAHFYAPSVRHDAWSRLRIAVRGLIRESDDSEEFQSLRGEIQELLDTLGPMEAYIGFPGNDAFMRMVRLFSEGAFPSFAHIVTETADLLETGEYREKVIEEALGHPSPDAHYFDLLIVKRSGTENAGKLRQQLHRWRSAHDRFFYNVVVVDSLEDALIAIMLNANLQACVIYDDIALKSQQSLHTVDGLKEILAQEGSGNRAALLSDAINALRAELCLFHVTEVSPEKLAGDIKSSFQRIFYAGESGGELHLSVLKSIGNRYETPFFDAVKKYSREPVGAFHALPISRGNSVFNSPWMRDFHEFYGDDMFLAESSATTGGLDSILQPTGTLKAAQDKASKCYGSGATFFVTQGTSTSNKIVHQAVTKPGDIVLLERSCHESHHFAFLLTGASPYYLEGFALDKYSISGAVHLNVIKSALVELSQQGLLERVRMVVLTNCTFDGLTYNVQRYMEEILAIKPDMIFLWDEAWFAFARAVPHYRQRTGMDAAKKLERRYRSESYRKEYELYKQAFLNDHPVPDESWLTTPLLPDPDKAVLRVYATQSTHKSLSCFRQGAMIHVRDELFTAKASDQFKKSYFTHTTTSPNYQILASLDVARRQLHIEGYALVQRQIEMALLIRRTINTHPLLSSYFRALGPTEMIPQETRKSGLGSFGMEQDWDAVAQAWENDEVVLDPCRINVYTAKTGIDGFTLRTEYLAAKYSIQVNKTGMNSFCLMTNVGTTRSAVAYLIDCLIQIATECQERDEKFSDAQRHKFEEQRVRVTRLPPLPAFSGFHERYRLSPESRAGKIREAFFDGYDEESVEHFKIDELGKAIESGRQVVGATFIVPVPPGYPMIAPGQVINAATVTFLQALNPAEILGLDPDLGVRVFKESAIARNSGSPPGAPPSSETRQSSASTGHARHG